MTEPDDQTKDALIVASSIPELLAGDITFREDFFEWVQENFEDIKSLGQILSCLDPNKITGEIEWSCPECKENHYLPASKTKLIEWISDNKRICEKCKKEAREERKREKRLSYSQQKETREKEKKARQEERKKIADRYLNTYLNPEHTWKKEVKQRDRISLVTSTYGIDELIFDYVKEMDYQSFLQTPYWKAIASEVRRKSGYKCAICNSTGVLHVHHRSYDNHGREHTYEGMKDLICLCEHCHEHYHN